MGPVLLKSVHGSRVAGTEGGAERMTGVDLALISYGFQLLPGD